MPKMHNHYEDLKVTRDAPAEVIRAAYKSLSQKFHPDRHGDDAHSEDLMKSLNVAYDVLSDPVKRRAHDAWIDAVEPTRVTAMSPALAHLWRARIRYGIGLALLFGAVQLYLSGPNAAPDQETASSSASSAPVRSVSFKAPNGAPWPAYAAYVTGYPVLKNDGLSKVTFDNSDGESDVFARLVCLEYEGALTARHFFVPAHTRFVLTDVTAGTYDIRYRELSSNALWRSSYFRARETVTATGKEFSDLEISPASERNGRAARYPLMESEF
jgi:hypothetical protein